MSKYYNIDIVIGGQSVVVGHDKLRSFEMDRVISDAANKFSMSVLDNSAFELEQLLLSGNNDIEITLYNEQDKTEKNRTFVGTILKMNSSFINNRNMLTLEGYVGLSIADKYGLVSNCWNVLPTFNWASLYSNKSIYKKAMKDVKGTAKYWLNNLYRDDEGNYYTFTYEYLNAGQSDENGKRVMATMVTVPAKPSSILKVITKGGYLGQALELADIEKNLKKASATDIFSSVNTTDDEKKVSMEFINAFCSYYKIEKSSDTQKWIWNEKNIQETQPVLSDLSQTGESTLTYIYNKLCANSYCKIDGSVFYNYAFSLNSNNEVVFKPVNLNSKPKLTLYYYGNQNLTDNDIYISSFSADTNILTAYLTGDNSAQMELADQNLITGSAMSDVVQISDNIEDYEINDRHKIDYEKDLKMATYSPKSILGDKLQGTNYVAEVWQELYNQSYKAEATVVGFNTLEPGDTVEIIILPTSTNPRDYMGCHHTSGIYYITNIKDNYKGGIYTSTLTMVKNANSLGTNALGDTYDESIVKANTKVENVQSNKKETVVVDKKEKKDDQRVAQKEGGGLNAVWNSWFVYK